MIHVVLLIIVKLPLNITPGFLLRSFTLIAISLSVVSCAETELIVQTAKQLSRNMEENRLDKKGVSPEVPAGYKLGKPYTVAGIKYFPTKSARSRYQVMVFNCPFSSLGPFIPLSRMSKPLK